MASFNLKQYSEIYNAIKAWIIAHQSRVTDFNTGSVIASEIEAFAREMSILYSEARSGFSEVLTKMPFTIFGISRHPSQKAVGTVTFSRVNTTGEVVITTGTQVATAGGVVYETTAAGTMANGASSVSVAVRAVYAGSTGNVPAGTVTVFVSSLPNVDAVINYNPIGGGVDEETDAEFMSRFRAYLLGLAGSNRYGLISAALQNPALRSASVVEHFPPKSGLYNLTLYLDDGNGSVSSPIIDAVKAVVDGDGTETNPGYRAAGINIEYAAPSPVSIPVTGTVYYTYEVASDEAKSLIDAAVLSFLNEHTIGQDVIRAQLQKTILDFPWVVDLDITVPEGNTAIGNNQIARAGTVTLTYVQVAGE